MTVITFFSVLLVLLVLVAVPLSAVAGLTVAVPLAGLILSIIVAAAWAWLSVLVSIKFIDWIR